MEVLTEQVKNLALEQGAHLVGIASVDRFEGAPRGHHPEDLSTIVRYYKTQLAKLDVKLHFGVNIDSTLIEEIKPDTVILATGGISADVHLPGIENRNVISTDSLHHRVKTLLKYFSAGTIRWLTGLWIPVRKRVVIIGGGIRGCQLAEFLVKRGKKVTIITREKAFGEGMVDAMLGYLLDWFRKKGVLMYSGIKSLEITPKSVIVITSENTREIIVADSVIAATDLKLDDVLLENLEEKGLEVYAVGDCREPNLIVDAIADGSRVARLI